MKRTIAGVLMLVAGVAAIIIGAGPSPAGAVTNIEIGYWWLGQEVPGAVPAPPAQVVPDGGLWVSSNPSGPQAISAVRFALGEDESAPILTLTIASETPANGASLLACPITSPWAPTVAGDWNSRPQYDCGVAAIASRSVGDGGALVAFDLSPIVIGKQADVAIVPAPLPPPLAVVPAPPSGLPVAPPAPSSSFDITFQGPKEGSVATFSVPSDDEAVPAGGAVVPPPAFTPPDTAFGTVNLIGGFPAIVPPPTPSLVFPTLTPTTVAAVAPRDKRSAARVLAAVVFLALAAWWYKLTFAGSDRAADASTRPRISIYDDPRRVMTASAATRPARVGRPPALR